MSYVYLGKVTRPHGYQGAVVVFAATSQESSLKYLKRVFVGPNEKEVRPYEVTSADWMPRGWKIELKEVTTQLDSKNLVNQYVFAERADLATLNSNEYYACDLLGCEVWQEDPELKIGTFTEIENVPGTTDRWWFDDGKTERSVPATQRYIAHVDIGNRKIWLKNLSDFE